jgi:hypothetical protein
MARPTRVEVREVAARLKNRDPRAELEAEVEFYITNLRMHEPTHLALRRTIADFLEVQYLRGGRGRRPDSWLRRTSTAWCWKEIERRAIFWRDVFRHRCLRRYPQRDALRRVAQETGFDVEALKKGLRSWRTRLR